MLLLNHQPSTSYELKLILLLNHQPSTSYELKLMLLLNHQPSTINHQPSNPLTIFLYHLAISAYHTGIRIAAWFSPKARAWVKGRRNWYAELRAWREQQPQDADIIWMHCASLGEFEQGRPVLERIRSEQPGALIVLTFYSPSGYEQQAGYAHADYIAYLPADGPQRAKTWIEALRPKLVIFVKYEFWAFYLRGLFQRQISVVLIGGIFRPGQLFFRWYGGFFLQLLRGFDRLFVQREVDAELLKTHGVDRVTIAGDPRIDRVLEIARGEIDFPLVAAFKQQEQVFIGGSTWPPGERILLSDQEQWRTGWKLLLAPHDIGEAHIQQLEAQLQLPYSRYSKNPGKEQLQNSRVLILDTIGMLSRVYHYGNLAYIGGGFGVSIHNILEPAAHGLPVLIGPVHHKFQEALTLIAEGGAFEINNKEDFQSRFTSLQKADDMERARTAVREYLQRNAGATERIIERL